MSNLRALALNLIQLVEIQTNREVLIKDVEEVLQELKKETLQEEINMMAYCSGGDELAAGWYAAIEYLQGELNEL